MLPIKQTTFSPTRPSDTKLMSAPNPDGKGSLVLHHDPVTGRPRQAIDTPRMLASTAFDVGTAMFATAMSWGTLGAMRRLVVDSLVNLANEARAQNGLAPLTPVDAEYAAVEAAGNLFVGIGGASLLGMLNGGAVNTALALRKAMNAALSSCMNRDPGRAYERATVFQGTTNPGLKIATSDFATVAFSSAVFARTWYTTAETLTRVAHGQKPIATLPGTFLSPNIISLGAGTAAATGVAMGLVFALLRDGRLTFADPPPFNLDGARRLLVGRIQSGYETQLGNYPGTGVPLPIAEALIALITREMTVAKLDPQAIAFVTAGLAAGRFVQLADSWGAGQRARDGGLPGALALRNQAPEGSQERLRTEENVGTARSEHLNNHQPYTRLGERILREIFPAASTTLMSGLAAIASHEEPFAVPRSAFHDVSKMSKQDILVATGTGIAALIVTLRLASWFIGDAGRKPVQIDGTQPAGDPRTQTGRDRKMGTTVLGGAMAGGLLGLALSPETALVSVAGATVASALSTGTVEPATGSGYSPMGILREMARAVCRGGLDDAAPKRKLAPEGVYARDWKGPVADESAIQGDEHYVSLANMDSKAPVTTTDDKSSNDIPTALDFKSTRAFADSIPPLVDSSTVKTPIKSRQKGTVVSPMRPGLVPATPARRDAEVEMEPLKGPGGSGMLRKGTKDDKTVETTQHLARMKGLDPSGRLVWSQVQSQTKDAPLFVDGYRATFVTTRYTSPQSHGLPAPVLVVEADSATQFADQISVAQSKTDGRSTFALEYTDGRLVTLKDPSKKKV